ncbi:hypothetical protein [Larkinella terrae]|uniref:hypothetical protein n=1 Tax=Larkinella terrae TaxID=2025311 RepID=UPI0012AEAC8D|nr:hypothetical protein [Larkinella terrae]
MSLKRIMCRFYRMVDRYDGLVLSFYLVVFVVLLAASFAFSFDPITVLVWKR